MRDREKNKHRKAKEKAQLGMDPGTARHHLVKSVLLHLATAASVSGCFRCGDIIEDSADVSIDHKVPWRGESTADLFWDVGNIALSHKQCNTVDRPGNKSIPPEGMSWCTDHGEFHPVSEFGKGGRWNGLDFSCLRAGRDRQAAYDARNPRFPCPECGAQMRKKCSKCGYDLPMAEYMRLRRDEGVDY